MKIAEQHFGKNVVSRLQEIESALKADPSKYLWKGGVSPLSKYCRYKDGKFIFFRDCKVYRELESLFDLAHIPNADKFGWGDGEIY